MAELLCEGFNKDFQVSYLRRWILHANIPTFSTASFSSVQHQAFQHDSKRKEAGKPPDVFLMQLQGTTHACSSQQQEAEKQWQLAAVLPHRHHPPLPGTAHPAPTPCRINSTAKRAEENPSPQARAKSIPGLLPCPTCREAFHTLSCPCFTRSQAASKSLHWHLVLNRLLNGRWT